MPKEKIKSLKEIEVIADGLRNKGSIIVTTNGIFDILHVGHIRYLQEAKKLGDIIIVAVNSDASTKSLKGNSFDILARNLEDIFLLKVLEDANFETKKRIRHFFDNLIILFTSP